MGLHVNCENIDGSVVINDFISVFLWFFSLLHAEKKNQFVTVTSIFLREN